MMTQSVVRSCIQEHAVSTDGCFFSVHLCVHKCVCVVGHMQATNAVWLPWNVLYIAAYEQSKRWALAHSHAQAGVASGDVAADPTSLLSPLVLGSCSAGKRGPACMHACLDDICVSIANTGARTIFWCSCCIFVSLSSCAVCVTATQGAYIIGLRGNMYGVGQLHKWTKRYMSWQCHHHEKYVRLVVCVGGLGCMGAWSRHTKRLRLASPVLRHCLCAYMHQAWRVLDPFACVCNYR